MTTGKKNKKFIFPPDTDLMIYEILKEHGLETRVDFFEKIMHGEKTNGEIMAELVKKIAEGIITLEELSLTIKVALETTPGKATAIAEDVKKRIFRISGQSLVSPQETPKKGKIPKETKDSYRESID